jgi:2-polyprenyl-3-methyl-5-hydroxy-6-metoxy-1,4-benzoquinol methylase
MTLFEKEYFIDSQISNYQNYLTKKFDLLAENLIEHFCLKKNDVIIDFGCGCGGLVFELKRRGFKRVKGTDISHWAIEEGKKLFLLEKEIDYYNRNLLAKPKAYVFLFDVLEHMPIYEIDFILKLAKKKLRKFLVMRVPVCKREGEPYVLEVSRNDKTHIQCHTRKWWVKKFEEHGYKKVGDMHLSSIYSSEGVFAGVFEAV